MTRERRTEGLGLEALESRGDGRNIDPELGELAGEGAHQEVREVEPPVPLRIPTEPPSRAGPSQEPPSYYGIPVVQEPVWVWSIAAYFYIGGVAGAASMLGLAADVAGRGQLEALARRCHWVGTVGDAIGGALLIHDLGRPERFLNMLRVFRPTSPMSMGSWILAGSGAANGAAVLLSHRRGVLGAVGRVAGAVGGVLGAGLAGYTAVLCSNTAVPIWQHTHRTLPLLFMGSAMGTCGAFLQLLPHRRSERGVLRAVTLGGTVAQLAGSVAVETEASRSPEAARPLKRGLSGALWRTSQVCTVASLALQLWPGRARGKDRWKDRVANVLLTAGGLAMRFAIHEAGKASANDPIATFRSQREGLGAAEVGLPSEVLRVSQPDRFALPVVR